MCHRCHLNLHPVEGTAGLPIGGGVAYCHYHDETSCTSDDDEDVVI